MGQPPPFLLAGGQYMRNQAETFTRGIRMGFEPLGRLHILEQTSNEVRGMNPIQTYAEGSGTQIPVYSYEDQVQTQIFPFFGSFFPFTPFPFVPPFFGFPFFFGFTFGRPFFFRRFWW
jgi:hypothetical protein